MSEGGVISKDNIQDTDMCICGHYANEHHWHGIDREWAGCSWCDCTKFVRVKVCPTCGQKLPEKGNS